MGMVAILFNGVKPFEQIVNTPLIERPTWSLKISQVDSEKKMFKDYTILHIYIAQGQGQITQGDKILIVTKKIYCFNHPKIIIWTNLVYLKSLILYINIQPQSILGSGEENSLVVFTIYGHGGHLIQWCETIWINCRYPFDRTPHMKSGEN